MPQTIIRTELNGAAAILTLARPEKRNALSLDLMRALRDEVRRYSRMPEVRVLILAADGKVFSAGHDLSEMRGWTVTDYREIFDTCTELMTAIRKAPQPVIAEVQGLATAAGCQLVAACDLVIASEGAAFATPGVRIGLFCSTPMVELSRAIGQKRALEMLLTGRAVGVREAADWGLVNRIASPESLRAESLELARQIAGASSFTVGLGKQAFYAQIELDQHRAYDYAKEVMTMNALAGDAQEGISAFLEKRPACWQGR